MKNLFRILVLMALCFGGLSHFNLFAQRNTSGIIYKEDSRSPVAYGKISNEQISPQQTFLTDFKSPLSQTLFYGDSPAVRYVLTGSHSGYIMGTNDYNDQGKYQRFDFTGNSNLEQVKVYFCAKKIIGAADNFSLVVRSVDGNGAPSSLLYSATYSTTVIDTSNWPTVYNTFTISPTVSVSNSFFVGIEWTSSFNDQFAIIADQKGKGNAQKRAWEKWSDGTFHDIYTAWQDNSTGVYFDSDLWIAAVINTTTSSPTSPVLILPANGATAVSTSPTLSWNASNGATSYRLQVSANSNFSTTVFDQSSISGTSQQINGLLGNTIYYWRVNATNSTGTSDWSTPTWSFTTGPVQDQIVIKYDNGIFYNSLGSATAAMTVEASSRFTQNIVSSYVGYQITSLQIYLKDLPLTAKLKIYDSGTTTNPGTLLYSQTFTPTSNSWNTVTLTTPVAIANRDIWVGYEVSFTAGSYPMGFDAGPTNANGDFLFFGSTWTHLSALSTPIYANWNIHAILQQGQQPSPPILLQPANGATNVSTNPSTTISWNASTGATSYRLQISTNSSFTAIVSDQSNITGTSQSVSGLSINTTYYWHVNATGSSGTSDWSLSWSFTTGNPVPQPPILLLPANGETNVSTGTTFSWNASVGATLYNLQISKNSNFTSIDYNYSDLTATSKQVDNLSLNTTYYWRVNASNSIGTSAWSETWIFAVPQTPLAPILLSPANGTRLGNNNPATFRWNASNSATSYRLQISENSSFSPNLDYSSITGTSYLVTGLSYAATYYWRVNASNVAGTSPWSTSNIVVDVQSTIELPKEYFIFQNYPNPFNPSTTIKYSLPKPAYVSLKIYNNVGQEVAQLVSQEMSAGTFTIEWNASGFTSGVYYYKIIAGNYTEAKKLILLK